MMKYGIVLLMLLLSGCGDLGGGADATETLGSTEAALSKMDFDVEFDGCDVFAGLARVPASAARALVPSQFVVAESEGLATLVVRVVHCTDTVVAGQDTGSSIVSHIGVGLVGPDPSVTFNNYTLWYATNNALLHAKLTAAGLNADKSNALSIDLSGGTLSVVSGSAHTPSFTVQGTASLPTAMPIPTSASWWDAGIQGDVRSRTVLPEIQFGTSHTVLTTPANSQLAALIGGTTLTFTVLDSYNLFPIGLMEVRNIE
jgi:hypothetical protein